MHGRRLPAASLCRSQQGRSHRPGRAAPSPRFACRSRSNFFGNAASASNKRPCHVCRAVAHSFPDLRALYFRNLCGPPHFQQDGCVRYHDRARNPHLRAMAGPARTHQENCPRSFSARARIFRLGQVELRRHSKIDIAAASEVGFRIRSTVAAVNNSATPPLRFQRNLQNPPQKNLFPTLTEDRQLITDNLFARHFQLAFSPPPDMMAAFRGSLETSHCLEHRKVLPQLPLRLRSAAAACSKSSACGSAWPRRSETPSPPASFEPPATSPSFSPTRGCFSQFGSSADSMHFPALPPWRNSVRRFPAAAASTISLAARLATTPDSSWVGATGFLLAAPPPPSPSSSVNTVGTSSPFWPAPKK